MADQPYNPGEKFTQPGEAVRVVSHGPSPEEIRWVREQIKAGVPAEEAAAKVAARIVANTLNEEPEPDDAA